MQKNNIRNLDKISRGRKYIILLRVNENFGLGNKLMIFIKVLRSELVVHSLPAQLTGITCY